MEPVVETSPATVMLTVTKTPTTETTADVSNNPLSPAILAIIEAVTKDEKFLANVKVSVDKILKDGKVDQNDVPELVFIITETVNNLRVKYRFCYFEHTISYHYLN